MAEEPTAGDTPELRAEIMNPYAALPDDPVAVVTGVDFPVTLRGYDRIAVDAYVRRVSELVRELHATRSPEAAVQRAVERVGGEVGEILKRAHETAEEVTTKSRAEAEERLRSSREEADETLRSARSEAEQTLSSARAEAEQTLSSANAEAEQTLSSARAEAEQTLSGARSEAEQTLTRVRAEAEETLGRLRAEAEERRGKARSEVEEILADGRKRVKELDAEADRVWAERRRIVDDVRYLAGQLATLAESAAERFPAEEDTGETVALANGDVPTRVLRAVPIADEERAVFDDLASGEGPGRRQAPVTADFAVPREAPEPYRAPTPAPTPAPPPEPRRVPPPEAHAAPTSAPPPEPAGDQ